MKKFIAIYVAPPEQLEAWAQVDAEQRKAEETKMREAWGVWMEKNGSMVTETISLGATKRIASDGTHDVKNGMMLYSIIEAESHDAAAAIFTDHPHMQIPGATVEVMAANPLSGM